ncbi:MAG TPA: preprotein translocase subunit SecE [Candidatus Sulfotelmatobacter sp.]|jgi:preprotein translocase subunit SecE|nr:preprotein translocase subunit SecE [Candidatus Sulfotelmatobacter sp.]
MITPVTFVRQSYDELKQVVWPSRNEIFRLTGIVIILSVLMGLYIGGLDWILTQAIQLVLK